ncbi:MAG: hypothetical protein WBB82_03495 [Limnothrix sp.]
MFSSNTRSRKSGTIAVLGALFFSSAIAPFISVNAAQAQLFKNQNPSPSQNRSRTVTIATGTQIPVMYREAEKIFVAKDETMDLTVEVAANLKDRYGQVLIPYGTKVEGRLEPTEQGTQFVARQLIFSEDDVQTIYGESRPISRTEVVKEGANGTDILEGALIGAGAAVILGGITGDRKIDLSTILLGGGLGALGGWALGSEEAEVVAIDPDRDLNIVLSDRLTLQPYDYRSQQTARNDELVWD